MSSSLNLNQCESAAIEIALKAGKLIRDTCGAVKSIESKQSYADLVTETDKNVEKMVFEHLANKFPSHKLIGEESVAADNYGKVKLTDEPTWIVDPVDGEYSIDVDKNIEYIVLNSFGSAFPDRRALASSGWLNSIDN